MADLKTNYVDDKLDTTKNTKRKYNMIQNPDGTISLEDVTEYEIVGSKFGASDVNAITRAINELNTGMDLVGGTIITNAVSPAQNVIVNKLTLSPGTWLIVSHVSFTTSVDVTYAHALLIGQMEAITVRTSMDGGGGTAIPYLIRIPDTMTVTVIVNQSNAVIMTLESNILRAVKLA